MDFVSKTGWCLGGCARSGGVPSARRIDVVTEYLLIGSLTSWLPALFPLVLLPS
jgi:hypothetical protein